jgi:hypothetical protein
MKSGPTRPVTSAFTIAFTIALSATFAQACAPPGRIMLATTFANCHATALRAGLCACAGDRGHNAFTQMKGNLLP